jgi:hypothetical protein
MTTAQALKRRERNDYGETFVGMLPQEVQSERFQHEGDTLFVTVYLHRSGKRVFRVYREGRDREAGIFSPVLSAEVPAEVATLAREFAAANPFTAEAAQ